MNRFYPPPKTVPFVKSGKKVQPLFISPRKRLCDICALLGADRRSVRCKNCVFAGEIVQQITINA